MRVAFVSVGDPEDVRQWSGIPYHVLRELREQGVEVEVVGPLKQTFKYFYAPYRLLAKLMGKSVQVDRHEMALRSVARQTEKKLAGRQFDVVFALSSTAIARLKPGLPVVFYTDAVFEALVDYYAGPFVHLPAWEKAIGHRQEQAAISRSAYAIYASDWAARQAVKRYKTEPGQIRVIEFGANLPITHGLAEVQALVKARLARECVLLFIGVDWERKGGAIALGAAKILNERGIKTTLKVVGCEVPQAPFVERLGFLQKSTEGGRARLQELLETSTFLIFPTRAEAAGIVSCEASGYGLPVISTKTGGVENYVKDGENGYCLPLAAEAAEYADLIERIVRDEKSYWELSLGGFERYQRLLNWRVAVEKLVVAFKEAAAGHTGL